MDIIILLQDVGTEDIETRMLLVVTWKHSVSDLGSDVHEDALLSARDAEVNNLVILPTIDLI